MDAKKVAEAILRLVRQLHPPAKAVELDAQHAQAARVAGALVARYRDLLSAGLQPADRPYLCRYTWRHCADGGPQGIAALRELVKVDQDAFLPDLASALNNLGIRYSEVGQRSEGLKHTKEAVYIYRTLAQDNYDFPAELAKKVGELVSDYGKVGIDSGINQVWEDTLEVLPEEDRRDFLDEPWGTPR